MSKVAFYIDGFNFYFGIKRSFEATNGSRWGCAYWIDVVRFCESFLSEGQELVKVVYFTASPLDPDKSSRQSAFLNANKELNGDRFEIVRGKYMTKTIVCPHCKFAIPRPEEKKTDVNISVRMIGDCVQEKVDSVCLISADTDLIPPLEFILKNFQNIKVKVYFPPSNSSRDIKNFGFSNGMKVKELVNNIDRFYRAKMPDVVGQYTIPSEWKRKHAGAEIYFKKNKPLI
ncbi:MAG: NYN domain-containing protein [Fibrobacter sp.]|jgi:hypothetical protein|nr:NYN domain-containing protein [Fibrobacter sp.]MBQ3839250.1 NYN domain-containing protein [Fibrobacter sp.]MBR2091684.1 NYN domain-containing protein [Fibrobacter sp.]